MEIRFLGAAGTVTGSKFLVSSGATRVLVDCGLYQGVKALRKRNWQPLPFAAGDLDAVLLTHAHLDHSGFLPRIVLEGFEGPVLCTAPTADLCRILLPDAGHIQEEDARYANRKHFSKHDPALPLYTEEQATECLERLHTVSPDTESTVGGLRFRMIPAGHILGASSILVSDDRASVLFSGDLGRRDDALMNPPAAPPACDHVVVESTYGDRVHERSDPVGIVAKVLERTVERGGILLIPSFAVGRAQTMLLALHEIFERRLAPRVDVFVNSPMATNVTELYRRYTDWHRLSPDHCNAVCDVATFVRSVDESRELAGRRKPCVIISASGMATGGRVLHHLKSLAPDPRNTILLPGFQAPGTRGASIAAGAESVKIHGRYVPIAAEVVQLDAFSAHADQPDLLAWLRSIPGEPRGVSVVHGEPASADALRLRIVDDLGLRARVPEFQEVLKVE
ncbi:MAG: MBL fold metallo-hydrolase RNA specificity domain-containing protein [Myxococcota bacterium]